MKGLTGKNVLVTGGSSGIGQSIALRFAEEGSNVAINYRSSLEEAKDTEEMVQVCIRKVKQCGVQDLLVQSAEVPQQGRLFHRPAVADLFGLSLTRPEQ